MENYLMHPADHVQNKIFMKTIFHFPFAALVAQQCQVDQRERRNKTNF